MQGYLVYIKWPDYGKLCQVYFGSVQNATEMQIQVSRNDIVEKISKAGKFILVSAVHEVHVYICTSQ